MTLDAPCRSGRAPILRDPGRPGGRTRRRAARSGVKPSVGDSA